VAGLDFAETEGGEIPDWNKTSVQASVKRIEPIGLS
jgi:hypothetical protein